MKASECMSVVVRFVEPETSIREASALMGKAEIGILPVAGKDRLVGILTDRDIVVRAIAAGKDPNCPVKDVMTPEVKYCFDNESVEDVARRMIELQIRRIPVVDQDRILVGIISLSDIVTACDYEVAGRTITGITRPGGLRSQEAAEMTA